MAGCMMVYSLEKDGFKWHRGVFTESQVETLRREAELVADATGSACVRHLRKRSRIFHDMSVSEPILSLFSTGLRPVRSILFDKTPGENWPVAWHQDLTIAVDVRQDLPGYGPWSCKEGVPHVQPPIPLLQRMVTLRVHLDPTPESNGALRVVPGSHRHGRLSSEEVAAYHKENVLVCECAPGDVLLMSPLLLHSSQRSAEPVRRRVIHIEYAREADLDPRLQWHENLE